MAVFSIQMFYLYSYCVYTNATKNYAKKTDLIINLIKSIN